MLDMLTYEEVCLLAMVRHLDERTASKMGRAGARKRAKNLSSKKRREIARKAALARWSKKKK